MEAQALTARANPAARWELDGASARFSCGELQGAVDVTAPARGLSQLTYGGANIDGWLLGVDVNTAPSDAYVRGSDLVVAYRETEERPFSVQVYWRVTKQPDGAGFLLDATISLQTRQWEAYPEVSVTSSIAGAIPTPQAEGAILLNPNGAHPSLASSLLSPHPWTYTEFTPEIDFTQAPILNNPGAPTLWRFGEQFMERGVIRRLRARGALLFRKTDAAEVQLLREAFLAEQPPLTA